MKKILLLCSVALFSFNVAAGYQEAENAFNEQRYTQAFAEFLPLAEEGDYRAQYYLGYLYLNGYGVQKDAKKAVSYLEKSIKQNYDLAQSLMAYMYFEGNGVRQDKKKAISLYQQAAAQGNSSALLNLGVAYYKGDGVEKNIQRAMEYFLKVSPQDQPVVATYLGDIYLNNKEYADPIKAFEQYVTAAKAGDIASYDVLARMYQNGLGTATDVDRAIDFYKYAAAKNYAPAQYNLGVIYANGDGIPRDKFRAYAWFSLAADQQMEAAVKERDRLYDGMSLSERERANRVRIEVQNSDMKNLESPLKDVSISQAAQPAAPKKRQVVRRRRR